MASISNKNQLVYYTDNNKIQTSYSSKPCKPCRSNLYFYKNGEWRDIKQLKEKIPLPFILKK